MVVVFLGGGGGGGRMQVCYLLIHIAEMTGKFPGNVPFALHFQVAANMPYQQFTFILITLISNMGHPLISHLVWTIYTVHIMQTKSLSPR